MSALGNTFRRNVTETVSSHISNSYLKTKCLGLIIQKHFPLNYKPRSLCISVFYEQFEIYQRGNSNDRQDTNNERQN